MAVKWMLLWVLLFAVPASAQYGANWNASRWTAAKDAAHGENPVAQVGPGEVVTAPDIGGMTPQLLTFTAAPQTQEATLVDGGVYNVVNMLSDWLYCAPTNTQIGYAIDRDEASAGVGDIYLGTGAASALDFSATDDVCLEAWVSVDDVSAEVSWIFGSGDASDSLALAINTTGAIRIYRDNAPDNSPNIVLTDGLTAHIAACVDQSVPSAHFWMNSDANNGEVDATTGAAAAATHDAAPRAFALLTGNGQYDGWISEIRMYVAAGAGDPLGLTSGASGVFGTAFDAHEADGPDGDVSSTVSPYLVARWSFNEGSVATTTDSVNSIALEVQDGGDGMSAILSGIARDSTNARGIAPSTYLPIYNGSGYSYLACGIASGASAGSIQVQQVQ